MKRKTTPSSKKKSSNKRIEKEKQIELKLSGEKEIRGLKFKLRGQTELAKEPNIIQLIILLKILRGINPLTISNPYFISDDTKFEALQTIKKISELLKNINIFLFYFKHYRIDEKIIQKIIPFLKYNYYKKGDLVFKEGEPSNNFYFLLKGKISFQKKTLLVSEPEPQMVEKFCLEEGAHFGEWDIVYERKKKTSAVCIENCHIISIDKETFKEYFESRVTKIETEVKNMLKNFLMKYMTLPAIKIERFIQTNTKTLFFKRNEVIYREGDNNSFLFMINNGEANLIQNFPKREYSFLMKYQYPSEYIKNLAKRIDYKGVIRNAFKKKRNIYLNNDSKDNIEDIPNKENNNENDDNNENDNKNEKDNKNENDDKNENGYENEKMNIEENEDEKKNKENLPNNYNIIDKEENKKDENDDNNSNFNNNEDSNENELEKSSDSLKLDLLLERKTYQNIINLDKGSIGGLEICTGITKFKYSLISNSDFTSVFKIDLRQLDGEHLTEFMLNLLPLFIEFERKIHLHIKKLKYIDCNLLPESCQKYSRKKNTDNFFFKDEENDKIYIKNIQKIDNMFQFNEGGFIKMNDYNLRLHKKKNGLKELLKENMRKDKKTALFLNSYVNEQNSKLKFRGMKKIIPTIPNYEIIDNKYENINNKNKENSQENNTKQSKIYYALVNGKNNYYLIDNNLLIRNLENKSKNSRNNIYSKKYQEMFDKLSPKSHFKKKIQNKRVISLKLHKLENRKINYKHIFINGNNYMRDLMIQKNKNNIHCYDNNLFYNKNKFSKSIPKNSQSNDKIYTLINNYDNKKLTFYDTGKYDIPLMTEINNI